MSTKFIGEICFLSSAALFFFFLWQYVKYVKREKKSQKISFLDAGVDSILGFLHKRNRFHIKRERVEKLRKIYIGMDEETIYYQYYGKLVKQIFGVLIPGLLLVSVSVFIRQEQFLVQGYFLAREDTAGKIRKYSVRADSGTEKKKLEIKLQSRKYTKEEEKQALKEVKERLEKLVLGENRSAEKVTKPLCLVEEISEKKVSVLWEISNDSVVSKDGSLKNDELREPIQTELKAVLTCGSSEAVWEKAVIVYPVKKTGEKNFWKQWEEAYQESEKKSEADKYVKLPEKVDGKSMTYSEEHISYPYLFLAGLFALCMVLPLLSESRLREKMKKRQEQLSLDYPEFIEHFVLLIGAGLTVKGAWEKIIREYQKRRKKENVHFVYEEMAVTLREVENGMSETKAYELFGKRTELLSYMKFCTLLVQNLQKGSADLLVLLEYEMMDSFQARKDNAKALGEKAGTKLLMPMAVMLVIVFTLILYAAFQNM